MSQPYGTFQQLQLDKLTAIATANSSHSTNTTKLTNIQTITDTKLSAIQNFLDKDHAQFHLKHHPNKIAGNATPPADSTEREQVLLGVRDVDNNVIRNAICDGAGTLRVSETSKTPAIGSYNESDSFQRVYLSLHDQTNSNVKTARCDGNGDLLVSITSRDFGTNGNLLNNEAMNSGTTSNIASISAFNKGNLLYEDSNVGTLDTIDVEASGNGAKYYKIGTLTPAVRSGKREAVLSLDLNGLTHLRLSNTSLSNLTSITASIYGSN